LLRHWQAGLQVSVPQKIAIGIGAFCGAMLGAKLPFAISDWEGLQSGVVWISNGKTIVCGMVGGYLGVELAKWMSGIRIKTGDSFAVPVAVAVGIGRFGCFVAGCCYGAPTLLPWGVRFRIPDGGAQYRHPTQIYEALFHLMMALLLTALYRRGVLRGQLVKLYILAYLVYRWFTELIRPEPLIWLQLTFYQWFTMLAFPVFLLLWWRDAVRSPRVTAEQLA
jgi:phosphatidylglycerol---prolipoprotein diacylglyceryl transferase